MKVRTIIFSVLLLTAVVVLMGCGEEQEEGYSPHEGTAEAAIVEHYYERGLTVTSIKAEESDTPHFYWATVMITTNEDEAGIKEMFNNDGIPSDMVNSWFCIQSGEIDGKSYRVDQLIINDDRYTVDSFVLESDGAAFDNIHYNVMKNDDLFLENEYYQEYLAQEKEEELSSDDSDNDEQVEGEVCHECSGRGVVIKHYGDIWVKNRPEYKLGSVCPICGGTGIEPVQ